ncbi:MAG: PAS domain S-box protein [Candidatus Lokiarchaeota archaeon]|nr:PAS domain S-box protein [Candidatus Lokiarchaeota archaeon]
MPKSGKIKTAKSIGREVWFKTTLDAIPEPAYLFERDEEGVIRLILANEFIRDITDDLIVSYYSKTVEEVFPHSVDIIELIHHALDNVELTRVESQMKERGAHYGRWFVWSMTPISKDTLVLITTDITESRKALEALERSEQEKSIILDAMIQHVNYYGVDDMRLLWSNRAAAESLGLDVDEIVGRHCHVLWHGEEKPCDFCPVVAAKETGEKHEAVVTTPDGRIWHIQGIPVFDDSQLVGLVEITADITEKRMSERIIRENHERLRSLFDTIDDMAFIVSMDRKILEVNSAVLKKLQYTREELLSKDFLMVHPPELHDEASSIMGKMIEGLQDSCRIPLITKDGKTIPVETKVTIGLWGENQTIFGISRDITLQEQAMYQVREAKMRVELFNDLMAHDLNNINQGVMVSLELLVLDPSTPKIIRDKLEVALQQVKRSIDLIAKVRKFSQVDREPIRLSPQKIVPIVKSAIESNQHTFPSRKLRLNFFAYDNDAEVMADEFVYDALYNIIHNAFKHTESDEVQLDVEIVSTTDNLLQISIADYGHGIPDDLKMKIFDRLDQRKRSTSGIGLTLVKRIMERYNGTISVKNREEDDDSKGTKFILVIPLVQH